MKDYNQYKKLIMFLVSGCNVAGHGLIFGYTWFHFYAKAIDNPFWERGNYVMIMVYVIIFLLFAQVFGALKVGYLRTIDVSFSQILAISFTNSTICL